MHVQRYKPTLYKLLTPSLKKYIMLFALVQKVLIYKQDNFFDRKLNMQKNLSQNGNELNL